jgi:hypothetical protein
MGGEREQSPKCSSRPDCSIRAADPDREVWAGSMKVFSSDLKETGEGSA